MAELRVTDTRGGLVESQHRVIAVVTDANGDVVASSGTTDGPIFWRSAAKPFQLWPLVSRGGVAHFGLESRHLALACASHNGEQVHRDVAREWLRLVGLDEDALACGGHPSLSPRVAREMIRERVEPTPIHSNCSGKHAAMLGLARMEGWPTEGYQRLDHPVQQAIAASFAHWAGIDIDQLAWGVDGCTAPAVAAPLDRLAVAWARLGSSDDPAMSQIRAAMVAHPELVAGSDRLDTLVMTNWPGRVLAKVGAEGVYAAAIPEHGLGLALKVEDGDMGAAGVALLAVLDQLVQHFRWPGDWSLQQLADWRAPRILSTRGEITGKSMVEGHLQFT